jgi:hypothetical protein
MLVKIIVVAVCCACLVACDAKSLGYVEQGKYDALQQQLDAAKTDLKAAQQQVSECQAHKYQVFKDGGRTWRLDTVTGSSCLLLTTKEDWKKLETMASSCAVER